MFSCALVLLVVVLSLLKTRQVFSWASCGWSDSIKKHGRSCSLASCGCSDSIKKHGRSCSLASCGCSDSIKNHGRSCSVGLLVVVLTVLKNTAGRVLLCFLWLF